MFNDRWTSWTKLATRFFFGVVFPEQLRANNPNGCFNWFEPGDIWRGQGKPASIKRMIAQVVADHALNLPRICITGLSAGATMARRPQSDCRRPGRGSAQCSSLPRLA
jgi:poly(3-hydroxybutyrate) depolymerase